MAVGVHGLRGLDFVRFLFWVGFGGFWCGMSPVVVCFCGFGIGLRTLGFVMPVIF